MATVSLRVSQQDAIAQLSALIEAGEKLLGTDIAKDEHGKFLSTEEIEKRRRSLQAQTRAWERHCQTTLAVILEHTSLGRFQLVTTGDAIFPRTKALRELLGRVRRGTSSTVLPPVTTDGLHPDLVSQCQELLDEGSYERAVFMAFKYVEEAIRAKDWWSAGRRRRLPCYESLKSAESHHSLQ